jgi:hypothetical protein
LAGGQGGRKLLIVIQTVIEFWHATAVTKSKRPTGSLNTEQKAEDLPSAVLAFIRKGMPVCAGLRAGHVFLSGSVRFSPNPSKPKPDRLSPFPSVPPPCSGFCSGLEGDSIHFQTTCHSLLLANARPEADFKYRSNSMARWRSVKAMAVLILQGRNLAVWETCP